MTYGDFRVGNRLLDPRGAGRDGLDVVVQVEHLTASAHFAADSLVNNGVVVLEHVGLDGLTVHRSLLYDAHVAQSAHRHVERSRNRRCREREHVDVLYKLLEALLLSHAEALLLVDDRKPQIAELNVLLD